MMHLVIHAAIKTMEGATHLERQEEQHARSSFQAALDFMQQAETDYFANAAIQQLSSRLGIPTFIQNDGTIAYGVAQDPFDTSALPIPSMAIPKPPDVPQQQQDQEEEQQPAITVNGGSLGNTTGFNPKHFVYAKPLVFNPAAARRPVDALLYTAVIMFDQALGYHQEGARNHDKDLLLRSLSFYDISLEILIDSALQFDCAHVIIATMNNKACVYMELGMTDYADTVLEELLSVIVSAARGGTFTEPDLQGVLGNLQFLKTSFISAAA
ncbi:expressed unknown protein [Seminavis robusta]|uniref:Uncharacterized protein n=1 Tax=Seminavis robusta TaxID=568900 RepID=A0A9N8EU98_9STRA|nr:expressed unknown protein [Seminavis robusta]|eukprot:Sro1898_g304110.1 n/a (269) ;mRNA; f:2471-3277